MSLKRTLWKKGKRKEGEGKGKGRKKREGGRKGAGRKKEGRCERRDEGSLRARASGGGQGKSGQVQTEGGSAI